MVINLANPITATPESLPKPAAPIPKLEGSPMDELIKGIRDLNLKMARIEERGQSLGQTSSYKPQSREGITYRCIWCDDPEHAKKDCTSYNDAIRNQLVFFKDKRIHLTETGLPLNTNFGKGGMKKLVEDMSANHVISMVEAATYGVQAGHSKQESERDEDYENEDFWPSTMELIASKKVTKQALHEARDCIRLEIGWEDPVDSLSVHAYITKCLDNEAQVEEKRKRENEEGVPSKRVTRGQRKEGFSANKGAFTAHPAPTRSDYGRSANKDEAREGKE